MSGLFSRHEVVEAKHAGEIETHGEWRQSLIVRSKSTAIIWKGALLDGFVLLRP